MRLAGRRILVTGGASGIGRATATLFAAQGARVGVLDRVPADCDVSVIADVSDAASVVPAVDAAVDALGGLDGIVLNAGIDLIAAVEEMKADAWRRIIDVNLTGAFLVTQAALPALKRAARASIVAVASGAALRPLLHRTAYCASKAALVMFAKALAMELAPKIRVNAVCPGAVETPLFRQSIDPTPDPAATYEEVRRRYVLERIAEPDELAQAILFLISDESSYVTGAALAVDGGRTFH